jgi:hypothetical protein
MKNLTFEHLLPHIIIIWYRNVNTVFVYFNDFLTVNYFMPLPAPHTFFVVIYYKDKMSKYCLMFAGCLINATDRLGNTALHVAARYGHELLISTLLDKGADPMQYVILLT